MDEFVGTGKSAAFDVDVREGAALPYAAILRWAHRNRAKVSAVIAMDESSREIFVNRALLRDTRNATMAKAILDAHRVHAGDLVVAYGGQLHMTLAGRYRYDVANRTPAGALLLQHVPRERIRSVMLSGRTKAPICEITPAGIVATAFSAGELAYPYFIEYPIFRATRARELFDYWVNLGDLTRIPRGH